MTEKLREPTDHDTDANERTFLVWLRTGLALLAGAVALASLVHDFGPRGVRIAITVLLLALSLTVTVGAYVRWDRAERALRENRSLPADPLPGCGRGRHDPRRWGRGARVSRRDRQVVDDELIDAGAMAIGALLAHMYVNHHLLPPWPGLLLMAVAGLAVLVLVPQRYHRVLRTVRAGHSPVSARMVPGVTLLLVLVTVGIGIALLRT